MRMALIRRWCGITVGNGDGGACRWGSEIAVRRNQLHGVVLRFFTPVPTLLHETFLQVQAVKSYRGDVAGT